MEGKAAIITGDIVDSTLLNTSERDSLLSILGSLPEMFNPIDSVDIEVYRGDGFQIGIANPVSSLKLALGIRAFLRTHRMATTGTPLDARLAVGIGSIDYLSDTLSKSDGEAFRNSGRLLDGMGKRRLAISTPWPEVNDELALTTAFADDIVSSWTQSQSRTELIGLVYTRDRKRIARRLDISRQMVDKSMKASKEALIHAYIERFEKLVGNKINEKP